MAARDRLEKIVNIFAFPILAGGAVLSLAAVLAITGRLSANEVVLILAVAIATAYVFERAAPHKKEWSTRSDASIPKDLGHLLLTMTISERFAPLATAWLLIKGAAIMGGPVLHVLPSRFPLSLSITMTLGATQFLDYWRHRLLHEVPTLWPIHAIHHAISRLNSTKTTRNHFLDVLSRQILIYFPLLMLGAPPVAMIVDAALITLVGVPAHSNIAFRVPAFAHRLIITPQLHRIHHNRDVTISNSNYGAVVPWFDMMFGTYRAPGSVPVECEVVGATDYPVPPSFLSEVAAPFLWPWFARRASRWQEPG